VGHRDLDGRRYSWDDAKRSQVRQEHGIDLADLPEAFATPTIEIEVQPHWQDGWRYKMLALSNQTVVVVVYTERADGEEIRLITAWKASRGEQVLYYGEVFGEGY
jgi:uncharacterized DUF497 family protein